MDYVEGRIFIDTLLPGLTREERAGIYDSMNDMMARLHKVDYNAVGLGDYGRPQAYVARQVARWTKQYEASIIDPIPEMDRLIEWLPKHIPANDETTIAHGDFRLGNLIVHPTEPRIIGVLDWELSTLGHPLADLAWNCLAYHYPPGTDEGGNFADFDLKALGIPSEEDYLAAYCRRTGRASVPDFMFFIVFSLFPRRRDRAGNRDACENRNRERGRRRGARQARRHQRANRVGPRAEDLAHPTSQRCAGRLPGKYCGLCQDRYPAAYHISDVLRCHT